MAVDENTKFLASKIDQLIKVNVLAAVKDMRLGEQVELLSSIGYSPKEIANTLNQKRSTIRVALFRIRKKEVRANGSE